MAADAAAQAAALRLSWPGVAGAPPGHYPAVEPLPGSAALLSASEPGRAVPAFGAQCGALPEQLRLRLPGPHPVLRDHVAHALGGPGRLLRSLLHPLPSHSAVQAGPLRSGGEPCTPVWLGRGHLLPLLLAGWSWLSCLLGLGSHPRGHRIPRSLPPAGGGRWGGAADGVCVKAPSRLRRAGRPRPRSHACWPAAPCAQCCQSFLEAPEGRRSLGAWQRARIA
ncbi:prenylated Rab acceptor protein 1 isoform X1 [Monodelphis domestica]|uniref:prenylated Rab acceptor protein 1 isoform X1 n=1 Tax=Monodelphis domestica TaxID=13616 RepID=UPI0024E1B45B|nr:prenylated Rab acceptor protein 1 isoform X1 [Monodelphis domestica]XP_056652997.1 prenylated Rab acceptor protein 1 isoform X1 [Monodelphis domestica]